MSQSKSNLFLDSLSAESRDLLLKQCVEIDLPLKKSLYEAANVPRYAYFLTSGIASVVTAMEDGGTAEVGLIGREGVVGSFQLIGPAKVATSCFIQLEATSLRIPFSALFRVFQGATKKYETAFLRNLFRSRRLALVSSRAAIGSMNQRSGWQDGC